MPARCSASSTGLIVEEWRPGTLPPTGDEGKKLRENNPYFCKPLHKIERANGKAMPRYHPRTDGGETVLPLIPPTRLRRTH